MVVAYQSVGASNLHGSIISYHTRTEFSIDAARFCAIDKTPILPNTKCEYQTSWAVNRVLTRVRAELGGLVVSDGQPRRARGNNLRQTFVHTAAPEWSRAYSALVASHHGDPADIRVARVTVTDDSRAPLPTITGVERLTPKQPPSIAKYLAECASPWLRP